MKTLVIQGFYWSSFAERCILMILVIQGLLWILFAERCKVSVTFRSSLGSPLWYVRASWEQRVGVLDRGMHPRVAAD